MLQHAATRCAHPHQLFSVGPAPVLRLLDVPGAPSLALMLAPAEHGSGAQVVVELCPPLLLPVSQLTELASAMGTAVRRVGVGEALHVASDGNSTMWCVPTTDGGATFLDAAVALPEGSRSVGAHAEHGDSTAPIVVATKQLDSGISVQLVDSPAPLRFLRALSLPVRPRHARSTPPPSRV